MGKFLTKDKFLLQNSKGWGNAPRPTPLWYGNNLYILYNLYTNLRD